MIENQRTSKITNASIRRKLGENGLIFPIHLRHQMAIKPESHRSRCNVNAVSVSGTFVLQVAPCAKRILYPALRSFMVSAASSESSISNPPIRNRAERRKPPNAPDMIGMRSSASLTWRPIESAIAYSMARKRVVRVALSFATLISPLTPPTRGSAK